MSDPAEPVGSVPTMPSRNDVQAAIPAHCFERSLARSCAYAVFSLALTIASGLGALAFVPLTLPWVPVWVVYALVCGTFATGVWVIAHECGHGAFCDSARVQDSVGFVLHSALLVPYFSWQRSHAIHHAKTNHVTDGETHVPQRADSEGGRRSLALRRRLGARSFAAMMLAARLVFGWPLYLLVGATGGAERGVTNHFWPFRPFSDSLFPARMTRRVIGSTLGVAATAGLLVAWAVAARSPWPVLAVYGGPYLVVNAWLVAYTWLQHTGADVPHYDTEDWTFVRGAFCSIDRPYATLIDLLHHRIGSTHVAHHLSSRIPHYHALDATVAVAAVFPDHYRYDPTPVSVALWRESKRCVAVTRTDDGWRYQVPATDLDPQVSRLAWRNEPTAVGSHSAARAISKSGSE